MEISNQNFTQLGEEDVHVDTGHPLPSNASGTASAAASALNVLHIRAKSGDIPTLPLPNTPATAAAATVVVVDTSAAQSSTPSSESKYTANHDDWQAALSDLGIFAEFSPADIEQLNIVINHVSFIDYAQANLLYHRASPLPLMDAHAHELKPPHSDVAAFAAYYSSTPSPSVATFGLPSHESKETGVASAAEIAKAPMNFSTRVRMMSLAVEKFTQAVSGDPLNASLRDEYEFARVRHAALLAEDKSDPANADTNFIRALDVLVKTLVANSTRVLAASSDSIASTASSSAARSGTASSPSTRGCTHLVHDFLPSPISHSSDVTLPVPVGPRSTSASSIFSSALEALHPSKTKHWSVRFAEVVMDVFDAWTRRMFSSFTQQSLLKAGGASSSISAENFASFVVQCEDSFLHRQLHQFVLRAQAIAFAKVVDGHYMRLVGELLECASQLLVINEDAGNRRTPTDIIEHVLKVTNQNTAPLLSRFAVTEVTRASLSTFL